MLYPYQFTNVKRDLSPDLALILKDSPLLISLIAVGNRIHNIKHEWIEDALESDTDVSAGILVPSGTVLVVADSSKYRVNAQVKYEDYDEVMRVTAIGSGGSLTVERDFGGFGKALGGTGTVASGKDLRIIGRPRPDAEEHGTDESHLVSSAWNAVGIVERFVKVPKSVENLQHYAINDFLEYQISLREQAIVRELNEWLIYGVRNLATSSVADEAVNSAGGLNYFHNLAGTSKIVDHAGGTLTQTMINDVIEEIVQAGGNPDVILCNTSQGRKISALNQGNLQVARQDTQAGQVVYTFQSDLQNLGRIQNIVIDVTFPQNKIAIFEKGKIQMLPFEPLYDEDATPNGADYVARQMRGKYTFEFKNAAETIGVIDQLS